MEKEIIEKYLNFYIDRYKNGKLEDKTVETVCNFLKAELFFIDF